MESAGVLALAGGTVRALTDEQERGGRAALASRCSSRRPPAAARPRCSSSASSRAVREDGVAPGRILAITFTERAAGELRERVRDAAARARRPRGRARHRGGVRRHLPRLLRAAAARAPAGGRARPGLRDPRRGAGRAGCASAPSRRPCASSSLASGGDAAVDLLAAYGVDRVRAMLEQVYLELRSRGQRLPRLPVRPALGEPTRGARRRRARGGCGGVRAARRAARRASALAYERAQARARGGRLRRPRAARAAAARRARGRARGVVGALRAADGRRVPGHQPAPAGDPARARPRQPVHRRRRAAVDLRLPPRRREPVSRAARELAERGGEPGADAQLPQSRARCWTSSTRSSPSASPGFADARAPASATASAGDAGDARRAGGRAAADRRRRLGGARGAGRAGRRRAAARAAVAPGRGAPARAARRRARARRARARRGRSSCCCARPATSRSSSARCSSCGLRTLAAVGAFWGHQQIGDLVAYLRALANPLDELALYGVLASPLGGCSRDCLALLARAAQASRRGAWEAARAAAGRATGELAARAGAGATAQALAARLSAARSASAPARSRRTIASLIERAIDATGYREHVLALDWGERRLANVHKLLRLARALRGARGPRPARLPRPRRVPRGRRADRAGRAGRGRRAGRRAADDDPRGQGPRVPGRVRRRPRAPAERAHARPARRRRARRPAPDAPRRRALDARRSTTRSCAPSAARAKPRRRTGSSTWR